jgi:dipeptidase E
MRLYLSSFRLGLYPAELVRLAGGRGAKALLINNAIDFLGSQRELHNAREFVDLRGIGLDPEELDLRQYAGRPAALRAHLASGQLIWVRGGNSFGLRHAMLACGFDDIAGPLIRSGDIAYGGYSAGVCVLEPSLRGTETVDNPREALDETTEIPWTGMNILPYHVAPHFDSDHPESADINKMIAYFEEHEMPYRALRDGEVIIVENGRERMLTFP